MERRGTVIGSRAALVAVAAAALSAGAARAQQPCFDLKVFAGRGVGDGGPAAQAVFVSPRNLAVDAAGNVFVADAENARIRRIDAASGVVTTVAGTGAPGAPQDGDIAVQAGLGSPSGVAVSGEDVVIADTGNHTVWRVTPDGILHRLAGSGIRTGAVDGDNPEDPGNDPSDDLNDGQLAVFATLDRPLRVLADDAGNVFIADFGNDRIRRVDAATGRISTFAGGEQGLADPIGMALGPGGALFVANRGTHQILRLEAGGAVAVVAGNGSAGPPVNGIPATDAALNAPGEVAVDASGVVYVADTDNNQIRRVTPGGTIERVTGSGLVGAVDGPGFLSRFHHPGVALGPNGVLLIADVDNHRIRRYDPDADLTTTIAGGDNRPGDGGPATAALLGRPTGLAVDGDGSVYVSEHDGRRVRRIDPAGTMTTVVNQRGLNGSARDGFPAVNEALAQPTGVAVAADGSLLIADARDHRVLLVDGNGVIRTFAGNGVAGFAGDGGPATSAMLDTPLRLAVAADGSVYVADFNNHRVRRIDPAGIITTVAGTGARGRGGDGGPGADAQLNQPAGLAFDAQGNLYVADFANHQVRRIDPSGTITTVAGSGTPGALGDGGGAGAAQLSGPTDVDVAPDGALLVVDQLNNKVRRVAPDADGAIGPGGAITTLLGSGRPAFADGPGPSASLLIPTDVAVDAAGNLLIADRGNQRVRIATPGSGCGAGGGGGGGPCTTAAECDDGDPCTADACVDGACRSTPAAGEGCRPRCAARPDLCIPGTGPARFNCLAEALVHAPATLRRGLPAPVVRCRDGDPACDADDVPGQCTFRMAWCLNQPDERIACSEAGVSRFSVKGPVAESLLDAVVALAPEGVSRAGASLFFLDPFLAEQCTELMDVPVRLRRGGRRPSKVRIRATAVGLARRVRDVDRLRLICLP